MCNIWEVLYAVSEYVINVGSTKLKATTPWRQVVLVLKQNRKHVCDHGD